MLELVSYGLTGLASMVVVAFCVVCGENAAISEKSSVLLNKVKVSASPQIQTVTENPRAARTERRKHVAQPSLLHTTSPLVKTGYPRDCRDTV
jgi:hypothetical protein